jgi:hypothetical protein
VSEERSRSRACARPVRNQRIGDEHFGRPFPVALLVALLAGCGGSGPAPAARPGGGKAAHSGETVAPNASPSAPADGGERGSAALPERVELLAGRLRLRAPTGAKTAARPHGIMAAETSDEDETRVILVPGEGEVARFVLIARESFALGTGDVERDAPKLLGKEAADLVLARAKVGEGVTAVSLRPKRQLGAQGALFVLGAVVERADRSLCMLSFYILPSMAAEGTEWQAKALEILGTLEAGSAAPPGARQHRLPTRSGKALLVELPRPFVRSVQRGPDFFVYHLRELVPLGESETQMGVYIGAHPSHQWRQAGVSAAKLKKSAGTLLGQKVVWFSFPLKDGGTMSEAIATTRAEGDVHVFVRGSDAKQAELRRAAAAMRIE